MTFKNEVAIEMGKMGLDFVNDIDKVTATCNPKNGTAGSIFVSRVRSNKASEQFRKIHGEQASIALFYPVQNDGAGTAYVPKVGDKITISSIDYAVATVLDLTDGEAQAFDLAIVSLTDFTLR